MGALNSRIAKLEKAASPAQRFVILVRGDDETEEECIARKGYSDYPRRLIFVATELDSRI